MSAESGNNCLKTFVKCNELVMFVTIEKPPKKVRNRIVSASC